MQKAIPAFMIKKMKLRNIFSYYTCENVFVSVFIDKESYCVWVTSRVLFPVKTNEII